MVFSKPDPVEDAQFDLAGALAGESSAQQEILRFFAAYIRSCSRKFFLSEEDRRDLVQEGRIALFHAIHRYRSARGPFNPYARLVIRRRIYRAAGKMIQRNSLERAQDVPEELLTVISSRDAGTLETEIMDEERRREIAGRMKKNLTPLESDVLNLFLQGMSYHEMSRRLKRPAKSVDNALSRIRSKVKI